MSNVRAITFDVDGTLYAPKSLAWAMFKRAFTHRGLLRHLRVGRAVREELRARTFDTGAAFLEEEARMAAERLDVSAQEARALMDDAFDRVLCEVLRDKPPPLVRGVIEAVVRKGIRIAAISDRRVDDKLAAMGLGDLPWAARVAADDTGALKPSPRPFALALGACGVAPAQGVHLGDRDDTDGAGARAAGMAFVHVHGPGDVARAVRQILDSP